MTLEKLLVNQEEFSNFKRNFYYHPIDGEKPSERILKIHLRRKDTMAIAQAFDWSNTPEGKKYWLQVHRNWKTFIKAEPLAERFPSLKSKQNEGH